MIQVIGFQKPPRLTWNSSDESQPPKLPSRLPVRAAELPSPKLRLVGKAMHASDAEIAANPRARSAVMRAAERC